MVYHSILLFYPIIFLYLMCVSYRQQVFKKSNLAVSAFLFVVLRLHILNVIKPLCPHLCLSVLCFLFPAVFWIEVFYDSILSPLLDYYQYRRTLFYCALLYCTLQIFWFFTNWRFVATLHQVSLSLPFFPNNICSLRDPVSHFGNSHSISKFFSSIISVMVICDW